MTIHYHGKTVQDFFGFRCVCLPAIHLSVSLSDNDGRSASPVAPSSATDGASSGLTAYTSEANLIGKSVGISQVKMQDVALPMKRYERYDAFLSRRQIVRDLLLHFAANSTNYPRFIFGLDAVGNPVGLFFLVFSLFGSATLQ